MLWANVSSYLDVQLIEEVILADAAPALVGSVYLSVVEVPLGNTKRSTPPQILAFSLGSDLSFTTQLPSLLLEFDSMVFPFGAFNVTQHAECVSHRDKIVITSFNTQNTFTQSYAVYVLKDKNAK